MITKDTLDCQIEDEAVEYFNKSPLSSSNPEYIFKDEVYEMLMDEDGISKFLNYDLNNGALVRSGYYLIFVNSDVDKITFNDMKQIVDAFEKYVEFYGKADKLLKMNERKKELSKDFV